MNVRFDSQACQSNAMCMGFASEVFQVTYDGALEYDEYPPASCESVEAAADNCPPLAITIID